MNVMHLPENIWPRRESKSTPTKQPRQTLLPNLVQARFINNFLSLEKSGVESKKSPSSDLYNPVNIGQVWQILNPWSSCLAFLCNLGRSRAAFWRGTKVSNSLLYVRRHYGNQGGPRGRVSKSANFHQNLLLVPCYKANNGRDPFPTLVARQRMPKAAVPKTFPSVERTIGLALKFLFRSSNLYTDKLCR